MLTVHMISNVFLAGSEGKLTVMEQRIWMLTGIGNLSQHTVSGAQSLHNLSSQVAELFLLFLQQEGMQILPHVTISTGFSGTACLSETVQPFNPMAGTIVTANCLILYNLFK